MTGKKALLIALSFVGIVLLVLGGFYLARPLSFRIHYGFIAVEHGEELILYLASNTASWFTPAVDADLIGVNSNLVEVLSAGFVRGTRARPYTLQLKLRFTGESGDTVIIEGLKMSDRVYSIGSIKLLGVTWSDAPGVHIGYGGGFAQATSPQELKLHIGLQGQDCSLVGCYPEPEIAEEIVIDNSDPGGKFVLNLDPEYWQKRAVLIWRPALQVSCGDERLTVPGPLNHMYLEDK